MSHRGPAAKARPSSVSSLFLLDGSDVSPRTAPWDPNPKGNTITTDSSSGPTPDNGFVRFELCDELLHAISEAGFQEPRPIQTGAIPAVLAGRDVLGLAQTGTGKTAAFALPILQHLSERARSAPKPTPKPARSSGNSRGRGQNQNQSRSQARARALILAPTRELAVQIQAEISTLAQFTNLGSTTVFGGVSAASQTRALRRGTDIIVACPGRLLDLMGSGDADVSGVEVLVLDEADHMLDMGFLPDIKRILSKLPKTRQNLLFSATMPKEIRTLTKGLLRDPHVVEMAHAAPLETIEHALYPVAQKDKVALLRHLIAGKGFRSAIVFLRTKHRAKSLALALERDGHHAVALQGNMSQNQRQRAMSGFRSGAYDVLVATDIAARGIDVAGVSHVINFDVPDTPEAYTHRIGRTGRAERTGKAYTFVTHEDFPAVKDIERTLDMQIRRIKLKDFARTTGGDGEVFTRKPRQGGGGGKGRPGGGGGGGGGPRGKAAASKLSKGKRKRQRVGGAKGATARPTAKKATGKRGILNVGRRPR